MIEGEFREAIGGLRERMTRGEEDRREMWREQGRAQERLAGHDKQLDALEDGIDRVEAKTDSHSKLLWGILAAVLTLSMTLIGNLILLLQSGGGP